MSAQAMTPEAVLKSAWSDDRVKLHQEAQSITSDAKSYNLIDRAEFRFSHQHLFQDDVNNGLTLYPIKYGLRFYPKGLTEYQTTVQFQNAMESNEKTAQSAALSQLLAQRYGLLARVALLREKHTLIKDLSKVTQKANQMLSYRAQKDSRELKSYLKSKSDLNKLELKISGVEREYKNLQSELNDLKLGTIETFDLGDLASMDDLRVQLEKAVEEKVPITLSAKMAELELAKSRAGIAYARAKDEKVFDHFEVTMSDNYHDKVYGLQLAFNLPFAAAPNLSRIDQEVRELRDKAKLVKTLETSERDFKNSLTELKTLLDVYKSLRDVQARMNPEQMLKASRAIAPQDPQLAIELQQGWFEGREQLLDLEFKIRSLFVVYLHESSTIANAPEINYLSKSLKRIL